MSERSDQFWPVLTRLDTDYEPYGKRSNNERGADCSCGCKFFKPLYDERDGSWDCDWGVCINPKSPRAGLLTWEHQGCHHYEDDPALFELESTVASAEAHAARQAAEKMREAATAIPASVAKVQRNRPKSNEIDKLITTGIAEQMDLIESAIHALPLPGD